MSNLRQDARTAKIHRFPNGYGASVISHGYGGEDGRYEVALTRWHGDTHTITTHPGIPSNVAGWLTKAGVRALLDKIRDLPALGTEGEEG